MKQQMQNMPTKAEKQPADVNDTHEMLHNWSFTTGMFYGVYHVQIETSWIKNA